MLTTLPRTRVVSEAEPIESILRLPLVYGMAADDEWLKILRATIQTLGGSRRDIDRYVVKFDPWHSVDIETVRRAFPGVPCLFVYRHPLEVFASHARSVGGRMLGGPVEMYLSGLTPTDLAAMSIEEFWIHALRRWSEAGLDASHGGVRLVEYEQLPEIVPDLAEEYLHLPERATWWDSMTRLANQNAKSPETAFVQDSATRRDGVPEPWRSLIARDLVPVHHALEVQRLRQAGGKEPPSSAEAPSDYWRGG
jgi:hypothetical protein